MAVISLFEQLTGVCSAERIGAYRIADEPDIDVLTRYVWNMALCESFYPSLLNLEVGLRNRLHDALVKSYNYDEWYADSGIVLDASARLKVEDAKEMLKDEGKDITPSRVVSELSFGFWTTLFSAQHHEAIWERPGLLKDAFPNMPKMVRKRSTLAGRFGEARKLRNRVFHYEPIWRRANLVGEHANIIEALGWLDPCLQRVTAALDRFADVNSEAFRDAIKHKLIRACPIESKLLVVARKAAAISTEIVITEP